MRTAGLGLVLLLVLSLSIGLSKSGAPAKPHPAALASAEEPKEEEIKAATPEDPGTTTVISPLTTWRKEMEDRRTALLAPSPAPQVMSPADHVDRTPLPGPKNFLHKQFAVSDYSAFAFTVPPHAVNPVLQGKFRARTNGGADSAGSQPADVSLVLMNEEEFSHFVRGQMNDSLYEADPSSNQQLKYALPPTHERAQTYHLVFQNPDGPRTTLVEADFTVSFQ